MGLDHYAVKEGKELRCGYTTGTCAAAATSAAAKMLFSGKSVASVRIATPKGIVLDLPAEEAAFLESGARCAVRKDAGDDPDMTDGLLVFATVEKSGEKGILICAGDGVGIVTKPGLSAPVGGPAVNATPRRMIMEAAQAVMDAYRYWGGLKITLSIPGGAEIARKTFNPRLGIEGGLSVLGTSGIVEPMSEQVLIDTIHVEMNSLRAAGGKHVLAFFGNYGVDFTRNEWGIDTENRITCSNYIGELLDYAVYLGFSDVLLIGHVGKILKLAQGIMNTHSRCADGRTTFLAMEAMFAGASKETGKAVYESLTTDMAIDLLAEHDLLKPVLAKAMEKISYYMDQRVHGALRTEAVMFSNARGVLGMTGGAEDLLTLYRKEKNLER